MPLDAGPSIAVGWCNVQFPPSIPDQAEGMPLPRAGTTLTWPGFPAAIYARVYAPGVTTSPGNQDLVQGDIGFGPVGSDPTSASQASGWTWQPLSYNSTNCSNCGANYEYEINPLVPAVPGTYAYAARFSADGRQTFAYCAGMAGTSTGQAYDPSQAPVMVVAGGSCQSVGTACGADNDCCAGTGSCQNSLCSCPGAGAACTPTNVCDQGTLQCPADGGVVCVDTGSPVAGDPSCGSGKICVGGTCTESSCNPGASCVPANPCHTGLISCNAQTPVCNDTGNTAANGLGCGSGMVCNGGSCQVCNSGSACTPADPCHKGQIDCSSGSPVCSDTGTNATDGTGCGTGEVCTAGSCGCAPGTSSCPPNGCIDVTSDFNNCGVCGNICGPQQLCIQGTCTVPPNLPAARCNAAMVLGSDGQVYLLGGTDPSGTASAAVYVYSPVTNVWGTAPSMSLPRVSLAAVTGTDGRIYALGGTTPDAGSSSSVEAYDLTARAWSPEPSMQIGRKQHGAALGGDGRIYAVEGIGPNSAFPITAVEALNTSTQVWSSVASLDVAATPQSTPVVLAGADGSVYAFIYHSTNVDFSTQVRAYDPSAGTWTVGTTLTYQEPMVGTVVPGGFYLFMDDTNPNNTYYSYTMQTYSPSSAGWTTGHYVAVDELGAGMVGGLAHGRILALDALDCSTVFLYDPTVGDWTPRAWSL